MQQDLQGLEITKGELRRLSGVDPDDVFRPSILQDSGKRFSFFLNEILLGLALTPIIVGFIYAFIILPNIGSSIQIAIALLIAVPICVAIGRWIWLKSHIPTALCNLLDDVDKYNAMLKAIAIHDELESAGATPTSLSDRSKIISALELTRVDLVGALRTERILRENKAALATNPEIINNNLRSLQSMQISDRASEYNQLLNEALQISISVQAEMRKLQSPANGER